MSVRRHDGLATLPFFLLMAAVFAVDVGYGIVLPVLPFLRESLVGARGRFSVVWPTGMIAALSMAALSVGTRLGGKA